MNSGEMILEGRYTGSPIKCPSLQSNEPKLWFELVLASLLGVLISSTEPCGQCLIALFGVL